MLRLPARRLPNGEYAVAFVGFKSRVSPLKKVTLPGLESVAALIRARFLIDMSKALLLENWPKFCYTDSTIALDWINTGLGR